MHMNLPSGRNPPRYRLLFYADDSYLLSEVLFKPLMLKNGSIEYLTHMISEINFMGNKYIRGSVKVKRREKF